MNFLHLKYLIEVEKCESISKAAQHLYVNQPRLSKIIKEIEEEANIKIFERHNTGVVPTTKGKEFLMQAKKIVQEVDCLKNMYQETIIQGIGLAVLFVGISGAMTGMLKISKSIIESTGSLILVLSLCFGALIGEFINIEKRIEQFGFYLKSKVKSNDSKFIEGFVSTSLVICVGAMAIVGSFQDGLLHDPSILISKAVMDFVIVMVFASTLGVGTIFSAIPIFVYQGLLTVCASFLAPYFTMTMISNISFVGSVLIFAVGTNLCFHTKIKVGNLLPAVFMPLLLALFM